MFDIPGQAPSGGGLQAPLSRHTLCFAAIRRFSRGSVRHGYLVGSAVAVLLVGAAAVLVLPRSGAPPDGKAGTQAARPPGGPAPAGEDRAAPGLAPQPSAPTLPSFDVVKVGPTGTPVIAGRAEPGSKVTVRDGHTVIGEGRTH